MDNKIEAAIRIMCVFIFILMHIYISHTYACIFKSQLYALSYVYMTSRIHECIQIHEHISTYTHKSLLMYSYSYKYISIPICSVFTCKANIYIDCKCILIPVQLLYLQVSSIFTPYTYINVYIFVYTIYIYL